MNRSMHRRSFLALAAATPLLARAAGSAGSADAHAASAVVWLKLQGKATPITPSGGVVHALGFSSDGKQIVADVDKSLYFIDAASGQPAREPFRWNRGFTDKVLLVPSPARAFVSSWAGGRGELAMLDWVADKKAALMTLTKEVRALAVSADGARLALGYADGNFQVVDALRGASLLGPVNAYAGAMEPDREGKVEIYALAFSADGRRPAPRAGRCRPGASLLRRGERQADRHAGSRRSDRPGIGRKSDGLHGGRQAPARDDGRLLPARARCADESRRRPLPADGVGGDSTGAVPRRPSPCDRALQRRAAPLGPDMTRPN